MTRPLPLGSVPQREAATSADDQPAYPTLSDHAHARRRFLKLCALSGAAATLGLPLTGCPGGGGGGGGPGPDWVPWDDTPQMAGGMRPLPMGKPVAVVVGGGPINVTFSDGVKRSIVVAAVLTPAPGVNAIKDCSTQSATHAALVEKHASLHPSSVLQDAAAIQALEDAITNEINATLPQGYMNGVSIGQAKAAPAKVAPDSASDSSAYKSSERSAPARAPAAPAASAPMENAGAPAPAQAKSLSKTPSKPRAIFKEIWAPCRRSGCTTCS
jgi:hypothetical protein